MKVDYCSIVFLTFTETTKISPLSKGTTHFHAYRVSHPFIEIFRLKWGILRPAGGPVLQLPTAGAGFRDALNSLKLSLKISTQDGMGHSIER